MFSKKKNYLILFFIVLVAALLRFYLLGDAPVGFHRDEAFLGYNAFSLLKTGKDMSGNFLPLHLQSYLYSPAGYSYASIPWIALFGLSPFSIRFASALFGTLTVILVYFFTKNFYKGNVALLASFFLSISPWHINLSRTATENTLVVFFITLGVYLYQKRFLVTAYISFTLTLAIYQAPRAFLPMFIPCLLFLIPLKQKRTSIVLFFVIILLPIFLIIRSPDLSLRLKTVSLFATQENQLVIDEQAREDGVLKKPVFITRLFHNKLRSYSEQFIQNYFSHFSYDFLFTDKGFPDRYRVPGAGLMYLIELPFALIGLFWIIISKRKDLLILPIWIFLGIIGSALTFDDIPNLQRTLIIIPAIPIITALGFISIYSVTRYKNIIIIISSLFLLYFFGSYIHSYYAHQLTHRPWYRQEGYKMLVETVNNLLPEYNKAIITNRETASALLFLFYSKYDPEQFQKETNGKYIRDYDRENFSKYEFSLEECPFQEKEILTLRPDVLYVNWGNCPDPKKIGNVLQTIYRNDETPVFKLVTLTQ